MPCEQFEIARYDAYFLNTCKLSRWLAKTTFQRALAVSQFRIAAGLLAHRTAAISEVGQIEITCQSNSSASEYRFNSSRFLAFPRKPSRCFGNREVHLSHSLEAA